MLAFLPSVGTQELLIILIVAMLLFGSAKLPTLMRNLGRSATEFKKGMRDDDSDPTGPTGEPASKPS